MIVMKNELIDILNTFIEDAQIERDEIENPDSYGAGFNDAIIETSSNILTVLNQI